MRMEYEITSRKSEPASQGAYAGGLMRMRSLLNRRTVYYFTLLLVLYVTVSAIPSIFILLRKSVLSASCLVKSSKVSRDVRLWSSMPSRAS